MKGIYLVHFWGFTQAGCTIEGLKFKMIALAKNKGNYDKIVHFSSSIAEEISWWRDNISDSCAPILRGTPDIVINTDASSYGWGASLGDESTGGLFTPEEMD